MYVLSHLGLVQIKLLITIIIQHSTQTAKQGCQKELK